MRKCEECGSELMMKEYKIEFSKTYYCSMAVRAYTETEALEKAKPPKIDFDDKNWLDYGHGPFATIVGIIKLE